MEERGVGLASKGLWPANLMKVKATNSDGLYGVCCVGGTGGSHGVHPGEIVVAYPPASLADGSKVKLQ